MTARQKVSMCARLGKLALMSALCVLASASAYAAGEFEAKLKKIYIDAYVENLKNYGFTAREGVAETLADCHLRYVLRVFTPDEVAQLDAWAAGGKLPSELTEVAGNRMTEATESCLAALP
jgi:hypothetical protein